MTDWDDLVGNRPKGWILAVRETPFTELFAPWRKYQSVEFPEVSSALGINPTELDLASRAAEFADLEVDDGGTVKDLEKRAAAFKTAHPGLFGARRPSGSADQGAGGSADQGGKPTFTRAQLRDQKFFKDHQAEILEAAKEGRVTG